MKQRLFYLLSILWGFPMTLIGLLAALGLRCIGYKPNKYGWCYHFEVGKNWGGVNLGLIFITDDDPSAHTCNHEHGHALQNCIWGPLMPFVISIPSAIRYWTREVQSRKGKELEPYDAVWYEGQATKWGDAFMKRLEDDGYGDN